MDKPKPKPRKRPRDPMQLAVMVGQIATGQIKDEELVKPVKPTADEVRRVMSALGKIGGPKGGAARAESLSKRRRSQIATEAAKARWKKHKKKRS
jgi:hypothetical protein